ncbi:MAG: endonuclease/exonuclease/phosphatase family protein [Phycisphaerales bacterium]
MIEYLFHASVGLAVFVLFGTLVPFSRRPEWWIRGFDFPRPQFVFFGVIAIAGMLAWPSGRSFPWLWLVIAVLLACVWQTWRILPYTPLWPKEVRDAEESAADRSICVLIANVLQHNRGSQRLIKIIRDEDPDVVLTCEPDEFWEREFRVLEREYSYTLKQPQDNCYGMLLHSRLPFEEGQIRIIVQPETPSMHVRLRLESGDLVYLHGIHPRPPSPTGVDDSNPRDAELLIVGREIKDRDEPTIVAGDLNDVAWSHTSRLFQRISGLLDPRKGRGMFNSFNAKVPLLRWPLDHIFHSDHFTLLEIRRLPAFGSDHFPILIRLALTPECQHEQPEPEPAPEDDSEAREKIDESRKTAEKG